MTEVHIFTVGTVLMPTKQSTVNSNSVDITNPTEKFQFAIPQEVPSNLQFTTVYLSMLTNT